MLRLSNIAIGLKLSAMSGVGILLVLVMVGSSIFTVHYVKQFDLDADTQWGISRSIMGAKASLRGLEVTVKDARLSRSVEDLQDAAKQIELRRKDFHTWADPLPDRLTVPENKERVKKTAALVDDYAKRANEVIALMTKMFAAKDQNDVTTVESLDQQQYAIALGAFQVAEEAEKLIEETDHRAGQAREKAQSNADAASAFSDKLSIGLGLLTAILMFCSAFVGAVTIARPLKALVHPLKGVAGGNFAIDVPGTGRRDEIGQIAQAVQEMAGKVSAAIAEIKASGREVTNASAEIATSTTDLSQRTEEQAASLEQTSAAMEELATTVKKNAENAQLANTDANNTQQVADRGGQVVAQAVDAMAKIEESSHKISDIIGVIDEIARQTNLLALNAAVEAARAGEAGRGFAVVASEVRSLAQRSSQAAKDIKGLITNSSAQVKDGVDLVNKAGASLNEIVESIKKVAAVVSDIANASLEQATGIDEINRALSQMDEVTQQNSALVEENAATAKTLEHQAKAMDDQVAFFQIAAGDDSHAGRHSVATAAVQTVAAEPVAKPAAKPVVRAAAAPAPRAAGGGPARQMQMALASAVNADSDWKEF